MDVEVLVLGLALITDAEDEELSSLTTATFGPTVITVGRTSVNAKVDPGSGSRYGGGLLDFLETCVGIAVIKCWGFSQNFF